MKAWASAHRWWLLGAALAVALVAGAFIGWRSRKPAPPAVAVTQDVAQGLSGASQQHRMGKATARFETTRHDPATGAVTGKDVIVLECEDESEQEQAVSGQQHATQAVTVAPPPVSASRPEWRLIGSARWDPLALKPQPSEVSLGVSRRLVGPLSVGAEVAADPGNLSKPRVGLVLQLELP